MKTQITKLSFFISLFLVIIFQTTAFAESLSAFKTALGLNLTQAPVATHLTVDILTPQVPTWEKQLWSEFINLPEANTHWITLKDEASWIRHIENYNSSNSPTLVINLTQFKQDKISTALINAMNNALWIQLNSLDLFKHKNLIQIFAHDVREPLKYDPDIWGPSVIAWNHQIISGSQVTTLAAGALALMAISKNGNSSRDFILQALGGRDFSWIASGLPTQTLGFQWTGPQCFVTYPQAFDSLPEFIKVITYRGGRLVQTTAGGRIIFPKDPITLTQLTRFQFDDMLTLSPSGFALSPRGGLTAPGSVEIFQRPYEASPCNIGPAVSGRYLELSL